MSVCVFFNSLFNIDISIIIFIVFCLYLFLFQEALRVYLHGRLSFFLLSDPLLPVPPECHPHPRVSAVSYGLLQG